VHAVNVGLFGRNAFKNVIVTGNLAGDDGRKMSKSYGNYTDPNELMDKYSADALRFLFLSSPLLNAEDFSLHDKDVADVNRKLAMVGNMYDFFTMYAEVDGWEWNGKLEDPLETCQNPLDQWIISRLHQLVQEVERHMDVYDIPNAVKPILPFLEDASNWYVRRSRRRFWKSGDDQDKKDAYHTLHYVLVRLMYVMAPFTPFLAEEYYQKLTGGDSIHLRNWLAGGHVNEISLETMEFVKQVVNEGLSIRAKEQLKVRQPLSKIKISGAPKAIKNLTDYTQMILDELNVKKIDWLGENEFKVELDTEITPELKCEGLAREVIRHVQSARKKAGLDVDNRINLKLKTSDEQLQKAIHDHETTIKNETLTSKLSSIENGFEETVKIEDFTLTISLKKT
jgi:isoleucyl-tRNA synthetase